MRELCVRFVGGGGGESVWELSRQSESDAAESQLDDASLLAPNDHRRHGRHAHHAEGSLFSTLGVGEGVLE